MIKVVLRTEYDRVEDTVEGIMTIREFLERHNVDYSRGFTMIDGGALSADDMDKTFDSFGVATTRYVSNITPRATPCLICGEDVPVMHLHDTPKICDKCKDAVMKLRKEGK